MQAGQPKDRIDHAYFKVDAREAQRRLDEIERLIFGEQAHVDVGEDVEERRGANGFGVAQLDQLAAAGRDQRQMMLNGQAAQTVEKVGAEVGIHRHLLKFVQQKHDVLILFVDDVEQIGQRKIVDGFLLANLVDGLDAPPGPGRRGPSGAAGAATAARA